MSKMTYEEFKASLEFNVPQDVIDSVKADHGVDVLEEFEKTATLLYEDYLSEPQFETLPQTE